MSAAAVTVGVVVAVPLPSAAAGGEQGHLLIKGVGAVYAGPGAVPLLVTTAGGTATFSFEVLNTGTSTSQYNLSAHEPSGSCDPSGCPNPTMVVDAGSANITASILSANGYFTAPIAAGKTAVYTMKITTPKTAVADNLYNTFIGLSDTAGSFLSSESAFVAVKDTTGTTDYDQFLTGKGQSTVRAPGTSFTTTIATSTTTVGVGQTATFTVKLQNDASAPSVIGYQLTELFRCSSFFQVTAKVGTVNVTTAATGGTYKTASLAHGKSTTLTITMKLLEPLSPCVGNDNDQWISTTTDSASNSATGLLLVNTTS